MPLVTVGLKFGNNWYPVEAYIDSGAIYSVFHFGIAAGAAIDFQQGEKIFVQVGDGGFIPVYLHTLELQLGRDRFTAPIGFSDKLGIGFNLLGRRGIFDRFKICFDEKNRLFSFEL